MAMTLPGQNKNPATNATGSTAMPSITAPSTANQIGVSKEYTDKQAAIAPYSTAVGVGQQFINGGFDPNMSLDYRNNTPAFQAATNEGNYERDLRKATGLERSNYEGQARSDLAANLAGVKRDSSSRGLLYSGIKQGQDVASTNQAAAQLAQGSAQAAQSYRDKLAQYRGEQVNRGLDEYQLAQEKAASDYSTALQNRKNAQQAAKEKGGVISSIGQAAGTAAGAAFLPF